jgi:hypothetical protein
MRGGDDGKAVVPGNPKASDIIRRVLLPPATTTSMPSDGDKPLTPRRSRCIERWIAGRRKRRLSACGEYRPL